MILRLSEPHGDALLGAMRAIALAHGDGEVTAMDRATILAAADVVLDRRDVDPDTLDPAEPAALTAALASPDDARQAVRFLAVMALVDGKVDADKIALVEDYARALGVDEVYLHTLAEAAEGEIAAASACMVRKNAESFPHVDHSLLDVSAIAPFLPYTDGRADPELEARYEETLGPLPPETFGRAFYDHFKRNGFEFPGNPAGLAEGFTTPHDSSHVLSGYSTSQQGELCVSTFIGAMHPDHPMAAEVLPVIFSWHLGVKLNDIARSATGFFEPRRFWTAWDRGAQTTVDVVAPDWDFWSFVDVPLDELRERYGVPPVDEALLA